MKDHRTLLMLLIGLGILFFQCPDSRKSDPVPARFESVPAADAPAATADAIAPDIIALRDACLRALSLRNHELSESEIDGCKQYGEKAAGSLAAQHDRYWRLINLLLRARGIGGLHTHGNAR